MKRIEGRVDKKVNKIIKVNKKRKTWASNWHHGNSNKSIYITNWIGKLKVVLFARIVAGAHVFMYVCVVFADDLATLAPPPLWIEEISRIGDRCQLLSDWKHGRLSDEDAKTPSSACAISQRCTTVHSSIDRFIIIIIIICWCLLF